MTNVLLPVKSALHYFNMSSQWQSASIFIFICIFILRILNIVILVSLLTCALGFNTKSKTIHLHTLKNAGLFLPKFGSNMDKPKYWVKNVITNIYSWKWKWKLG